MNNLEAVIAICSVNVAVIGIFCGLMFWLFGKLDKDIRNLREDLLGINNELAGWSKHLTAMQAKQSERTDKLYEMFIELVKQNKQC